MSNLLAWVMVSFLLHSLNVHLGTLAYDWVTVGLVCLVIDLIRAAKSVYNWK